MKISSHNLFKTIVCKFKQFCEYCTLHGAYYLYQNSAFWLHCIWVTIIGSGLCLCVYLSHMIWWKFVDNPTFTVVESTHYSIESITFPAVSICDSETVYFPNTDNITWILSLRGYDQEQIQNFYYSFNDIKNINNGAEIKSYVEKMHRVLDELGYTYDTLVNQFSKPCDVLIRECLWRSKRFECSKMFRKVITVMGYCCQFDVTYFREQVEDNINFDAGVEIVDGMEIFVNAQSMLANGSAVDSSVQMYVFDYQNELTLVDNPVTVTGNTYFDVTVAVWAIDSSEDVKSLSLKNRKCFLSTDKQKGGDSFEGCITLYMMQKVVVECRCRPFQYEPSELKVEYLKICTWERLKCVYNMMDQIQNDIQYKLLGRKCYQKCDHVQYETEITYLKIDRNIDYLQRGESRVAVHLADSTCIKYRREVLYTWDQMLANLGGIFGLCLGGSIVSILELVWFLLEIFLIVIGVQKRKVEPKKDKVKTVLILSKKKSPSKNEN